MLSVQAAQAITGLTQDGAGSVSLTVAARDSGAKFRSTLVVRAMLPDGQTVDFAEATDIYLSAAGAWMGRPRSSSTAFPSAI